VPDNSKIHTSARPSNALSPTSRPGESCIPTTGSSPGSRGLWG